MSVVPSLSGRSPFQIGFVVRGLERAVREFDETLGAASTTAALPRGRCASP